MQQREPMNREFMNREHMNRERMREAEGALRLAYQLGLLEDPSMKGLEVRRWRHNEKLQQMEQAQEVFYGPRYFSAPAYLQYELTRLKLDFVQPSEAVKKTGVCPDFTEQQKRMFYEQNMDLFGRYQGDFFPMKNLPVFLRLITCLSWLCIIGGTAVRCPVHPCGRSGADEFGAGDHRRAVFTGR